ncbi:MAG: hypothetical protein IT381_16715 [Deltaproteobacteria bacterium]|nr:hypothetical protein [Deltaproteobacteria bacterium]
MISAVLAIALGAAAPAAAPAPASQPASAEASSEPVMSQAELELRLDRAIETLLGKEHAPAAIALHFVYKAMAEDELKRDVAQYYLAEALRELGYTQAAVEHYIDVVTSRRAPDMVSRALTALDGLARRGLVEEGRLIDDVLFGAQYGELEKTTQGFVEYYQALGELRRGYGNWGEQRLEALFAGDNHYSYAARYALGVGRMQQDNAEGAEKLFVALIEDKKTPQKVKNDCRTAMGRLRYEQKRFDEAFDFYSQVDSPPSQQAAVLAEKAWSKVASEDEQRALGMTVGLGAPIYRKAFAPERELIRALSLNRLCQFRAAHRSVLQFRDKYADLLKGIRERTPLAEMPLLVEVALSREEIREIVRIYERTKKEKDELGAIVDKALRGHLQAMYDTRGALLERKRDRKLEGLLERTADDLLSVDEQMGILDYEIGIGLFKRIGSRAARAELDTTPPADSSKAYFKFTGEYWSDELRDFAVLTNDRCVR